MILLQGVSPAVTQKPPVWHCMFCAVVAVQAVPTEKISWFYSKCLDFFKAVFTNIHLTQHEILSTFYIATLTYQASSQNFSSQNSVYCYWSVRRINLKLEYLVPSKRQYFCTKRRGVASSFEVVGTSSFNARPTAGLCCCGYVTFTVSQLAWEIFNITNEIVGSPVRFWIKWSGAVRRCETRRHTKCRKTGHDRRPVNVLYTDRTHKIEETWLQII